jgi:hypothetical protein
MVPRRLALDRVVFVLLTSDGAIPAPFLPFLRPSALSSQPLPFGAIDVGATDRREPQHHAFGVRNTELLGDHVRREFAGLGGDAGRHRFNLLRRE